LGMWTHTKQCKQLHSLPRSLITKQHNHNYLSNFIELQFMKLEKIQKKSLN
jgi:hypothetical protein